MYLHFRPHIERHFGARQQQCLVIEQTAHVAVQADMSLPAAIHLVAEILRYADNAINLRTTQHLPGFFHVPRAGHHPHVRRGIHPADKLAAHGRLPVVNHHYGHFPHHFARIDESIEQRIEQQE